MKVDVHIVSVDNGFVCSYLDSEGQHHTAVATSLDGVTTLLRDLCDAGAKPVTSQQAELPLASKPEPVQEPVKTKKKR